MSTTLKALQAFFAHNKNNYHNRMHTMIKKLDDNN